MWNRVVSLALWPQTDGSAFRGATFIIYKTGPIGFTNGKTHGAQGMIIPSSVVPLNVLIVNSAMSTFEGMGGLLQAVCHFLTIPSKGPWIQPGRWRVPMSTACSLQSICVGLANCKSHNGLRKEPGGRTYHPHFMEKETETLRVLFTPPKHWVLQQTQCSTPHKRNTHLSVEKNHQKRVFQDPGVVAGWGGEGGRAVQSTLVYCM